ncbi:tetratricopeptide repeat protein [Aureispira anguillae]|uniref:Tetratricopeptide repeat protein n=1 Tax=Aureispira anguillae TaxID=2864201 RepID=A0A916DPA9_9BACT|nr:tetratricopeptide repeat protein [Aureispira anguillae]BDS10419.1 tetratricopeptide repeat protein [Aureispira anguillae]
MSFSSEEIEQLKSLLLSNHEANQRIALGLLKNTPNQVSALAIPLCIVAYLSNESRREVEGWAHDLLITNLPKKTIVRLQDQIIILNYAQYKFKVIEGWNTYQNPLRRFLTLHENAIDSYLPLFQLNPEPYAKIYTLLANRIKKEWNNYHKALFFYEKAMQLDSNNTQAHFGFAMIVHAHYIKKGQRLGDADRVLDYYISAYQSPKNIISYRNAAALCQDIKDVERAAYYYQEGLKRCPKDTVLLNNYANLLMKEMGDYEEARFFAQKGLSISPHDPCLLDTMAHIEFQGFQDYKQAKILFEKVIKKGQEHHYSYTGLGDLYVALGNYDKAEKYYLKGLHNGLQYTSREIPEVIEKLEKMILFYSKYRVNLAKSDYYGQKLARIRSKH